MTGGSTTAWCRSCARLQRIGDLDATLAGIAGLVARLPEELQRGTAGFTEIGSAATDMQAGMEGLQRNVVSVSARALLHVRTTRTLARCAPAVIE